MTNMYAPMAFIGLVVMILLLNIAIELKVKEGITPYLYKLFIVSSLFCLVDFVWGLLAYQTIPSSFFAFSFFSSLFHIMATVCAYSWFAYTVRYYGRRIRFFMYIIAAIPCVFGIILVLINPFNNCIYHIDENLAYTSGPYRKYLFVIQYMYFSLIILYTIYRICRSRVNNTKWKHYFSVLFYTAAPIIFGILQQRFTHQAFYSLGFMLSAIIIFTGTVYRDEENKLKEEREKYKGAYDEYHDTLEAIGRTYVSIHIFNLEENTYKRIHSTKDVDSFLLGQGDGQEDIFSVFRGVAETDYQNLMHDFVDFSTLSQRMLGKDHISCEFYGRNQGWCISSFIRVSSDLEGNPTCVAHVVQNIDEAKKREMDYNEKLKLALQNQNTIYAEMLQAQSNGIIASNMKNDIVILNNAAIDMFGFKSLADAPKDIYTLMKNIKLEEKKSKEPELKNAYENGTPFTYSFSIPLTGTQLEKAQADPNLPKVRYIFAGVKRITLMSGENVMITSLTDITENRLHEYELKKLSEQDKLTEINNRGSGEEIITQCLLQGQKGMFCIIDINDFKSINDSFGHKAGDMALIETARVLKDSFRTSDIVMRLGGDEFAVFAKGLLSQKVMEDSMKKLFGKIDGICFKEYPKLRVSISVGIYFVEQKALFDEVYQKADSAMYVSKKTKGNIYTVYKE